jgi:hypothetical protein
VSFICNFIGCNMGGSGRTGKSKDEIRHSLVEDCAGVDADYCRGR